MRERRRNVAASIHARLLRLATLRREDFNLILQRYAAERFLYRLGISRHREGFVLKGAMLFHLWGGAPYRSTRDLDFAGYLPDDLVAVASMVAEICEVACAEDGVRFHVSAMRVDRIRSRGAYRGLRVRTESRLGTARVPLQIDIGLGDVVEPRAESVLYPALLDGPTPSIRVYPREAVIAEKLHAMVEFGEVNTRFKDFHDLFELTERFSFDGETLARSIAATFRQRRTAISARLPDALARSYYVDARRSSEWRRYVSRNAPTRELSRFITIGRRIRSFLVAPWRSIATRRRFAAFWSPGRTWEPREL